MEKWAQDRLLDELDDAGESLDYLVHRTNIPRDEVKPELEKMISDGWVVKKPALPENRQYSTETPRVRYVLTDEGKKAKALLRRERR